jgi:hypothetical protein
MRPSATCRTALPSMQTSSSDSASCFATQRLSWSARRWT